jgi:SAM-dependent methyltransferase
MEKLTDKTYWDGAYSRRKSQPRLQIDGFRNYSNRSILSKLLETDMENKRILEIGAGDSVWLPYLAKGFPSSQFVGVDYSESGCALLSERTRMVNDNVEVVHEDMFVENSRLHDSFDIVISFGVVEHFDDLGFVLAAKKRYLKSGGVMFTLIPNLAGILGRLVRIWNREVYDKHNPHDRCSFLRGHKQAGLNVISSGYLGSSNFGVLSSCFPERRGLSWQISRGLVATSLASWWFEDKIGNLPSSKSFSPYIYAISRQA